MLNERTSVIQKFTHHLSLFRQRIPFIEQTGVENQRRYQQQPYAQKFRYLYINITIAAVPVYFACHDGNYQRQHRKKEKRQIERNTLEYIPRFGKENAAGKAQEYEIIEYHDAEYADFPQSRRKRYNHGEYEQQECKQ